MTTKKIILTIILGLLCLGAAAGTTVLVSIDSPYSIFAWLGVVCTLVGLKVVCTNPDYWEEFCPFWYKQQGTKDRSNKVEVPQVLNKTAWFVEYTNCKPTGVGFGDIVQVTLLFTTSGQDKTRIVIDLGDGLGSWVNRTLGDDAFLNREAAENAYIRKFEEYKKLYETK